MKLSPNVQKVLLAAGGVLFSVLALNGPAEISQICSTVSGLMFGWAGLKRPGDAKP